MTKKAAKSIRQRAVQAQDTGYKQMFSHRDMVADLLRGYVPELARVLDLKSLERCNGSYVSPDLRARRSDVVWRLRFNLKTGSTDYSVGMCSTCHGSRRT